MIIRTLAVGRAALLPGTEIRSAIYKQPVEGPVILGPEGFEGDTQVDRRYHGGPDKAVCVYAGDHYIYWEERLGRPLPPSAFGENLTIDGLTEAEAQIGDIYAMGTALVQVAQPRVPCEKVNLKFGDNLMVKQVVATGYTGYYLRVLQPGQVAAGDAVRLVERQPGAPTVAFANQIRFHEPENLEGARRLVAAQGIAEDWIKKIRERLV